MVSSQSSTRPPAQEIEWLTPAPDGGTIEMPWPDENGPFLATCHLAFVDGRTVLAGLDLRSFRQTPSGPVPGPQGIVEVNHSAMRSLRAGEIADAARARLAAELVSQSRSRRGTPADREVAKRHAELLTRPHQSYPSGPRPASNQLERVAALFHQAVAAGGDSARRPSIYVHRALLDEGCTDSLNTVRGQIYRAQQKGMIPIRNRRDPNAG